MMMSKLMVFLGLLTYNPCISITSLWEKTISRARCSIFAISLSLVLMEYTPIVCRITPNFAITLDVIRREI